MAARVAAWLGRQQRDPGRATDGGGELGAAFAVLDYVSVPARLRRQLHRIAYHLLASTSDVVGQMTA